MPGTDIILGETSGECRYDKPSDPCAIVLFGATGDLSFRKILPSLYSLCCGNGLPDDCIIIGASRTDLSDEEFRKRIHDSLKEHGADMSNWERFGQRIFYRPVNFTSVDTFSELAEVIKTKGEEFGTKGNIIFHLAVPPKAYEDIAHNLASVGLAEETSNWVRVIVEKPFGHDLATGQQLNDALMEGFSEHQIYRIDHYLAKETVQNVLMFRFANAIFEPVWNRRYIESVHITAAEKLGVEHRAGYYDHTGVLRDMFQNHMMQLLSLVAMESPSRYEADRIRDEKTKVYRSLRPFPTDDLDRHLVLGQYAAGMVDE